MKQLDSEASCSYDRLPSVCEEYAKAEKLAYELSHAFIEMVYVYPGSRIDLEWEFRDFLSVEGGIQE